MGHRGWFEAGLERQPKTMPVATETLELLKNLGYVDSDE